MPEEQAPPLSQPASVAEAKRRGRELTQELEAMLAGTGTSLADLEQAYANHGQHPQVRALARDLIAQHPTVAEFIGPDGLLKPTELALQSPASLPARLSAEPQSPPASPLQWRRFGRFI